MSLHYTRSLESKSKPWLTLTVSVFWLGTLLSPPKSISVHELLEARPYLSYSALTACPSCQLVIICAPFEEVKVPVSNSAEFFKNKSATGRILMDLGWLGFRWDWIFVFYFVLLNVCFSSFSLKTPGGKLEEILNLWVGLSSLTMNTEWHQVKENSTDTCTCTCTCRKALLFAMLKGSYIICAWFTCTLYVHFDPLVFKNNINSPAVCFPLR